MKEWLRYFRIWFLVCGIILAVILIYYIANRKDTETVNIERVNKVCTETERVFDYAGVLTDEEENDLRELIATREQQTQCDIILVVMNESLEEYAKGYFPNSYGQDWAMIKADNFYDEHGFGWNKYQESDDGDGVLLLDNWYRESDGEVHTWLSTSGKAYERFSDLRINRVLDAVYEYDIEEEPYEAYKAYVNAFYNEMQIATGAKADVDLEYPWAIVVGVPLVAAVVFILINLSGKEGKKTTQVDTYVAGGGRPVFKVNENRFIRKTVTRRHIDRDSGSGGRSGGGGGGGGHVSSGGHTHGGGGRSR